jgi:hypothetical protein
MKVSTQSSRVLPGRFVVGNARARVCASDRKKSWTLLSLSFISLFVRRLGC